MRLIELIDATAGELLERRDPNTGLLTRVRVLSVGKRDDGPRFATVQSEDGREGGRLYRIEEGDAMLWADGRWELVEEEAGELWGGTEEE